MTVTIFDVAKCSGYSPTVVSHVLNGKPRVSENAKAKVLEAAQRLNYRPNLLARDFVLKQTKMLGIIIRDILYPFFPSIIKGVEKMSADKSYNVILCDSNGELDKESRYVDILRRRKVAGIIISPIENDSLNNQVFRELKRGGIPFICIDKPSPGIKADYVLVDNLMGAYKAVEYLIKLGHWRIGFIEPAMDSVIFRLEGYKRALAEHNISFDKDLVKKRIPKKTELLRNAVGGETDGYEAMQELLKMKERPTAVFAANDMMALGAYKAIEGEGLNIPADISVIGFDDIFFASLASPALTTVVQPAFEMGEVAAEILIEKIEKEERKIREVLLPTKLAIRESCAPKK